jgi:hypothetical protein
MTFDPKVILQGNADKRALEENPSAGFTASGSSTEVPTADIGKDTTRMAGPGGAFAFKMMQDPQFANNIAGWNQMFAQSNQGMEFNQAKIQMGAG